MSTMSKPLCTAMDESPTKHCRFGLTTMDDGDNKFGRLYQVDETRQWIAAITDALQQERLHHSMNLPRAKHSFDALFGRLRWHLLQLEKDLAAVGDQEYRQRCSQAMVAWSAEQAHKELALKTREKNLAAKEKEVQRPLESAATQHSMSVAPNSENNGAENMKTLVACKDGVSSGTSTKHVRGPSREGKGTLCLKGRRIGYDKDGYLRLLYNVDETAELMDAMKDALEDERRSLSSASIATHRVDFLWATLRNHIEALEADMADINGQNQMQKKIYNMMKLSEKHAKKEAGLLTREMELAAKAKDIPDWPFETEKIASEVTSTENEQWRRSNRARVKKRPFEFQADEPAPLTQGRKAAKVKTIQRPNVLSSRGNIPFEERLEQLKLYKAIHGDLLVPRYYKEQGSLGSYVMHLRQRRRGTKPGSAPLKAEDIAALDKLGFVWAVVEKPKTISFSERFVQLKRYKREHGDLLVPPGYKGQNNLGRYVAGLRLRRRGNLPKAAPLKDYEVALLDKLGFDWGPSSVASSDSSSSE